MVDGGAPVSSGSGTSSANARRKRNRDRRKGNGKGDEEPDGRTQQQLQQVPTSPGHDTQAGTTRGSKGKKRSGGQPTAGSATTTTRLSGGAAPPDDASSTPRAGGGKNRRTNKPNSKPPDHADADVVSRIKSEMLVGSVQQGRAGDATAALPLAVPSTLSSTSSTLPGSGLERAHSRPSTGQLWDEVALLKGKLDMLIGVLGAASSPGGSSPHNLLQQHQLLNNAALLPTSVEDQLQHPGYNLRRSVSLDKSSMHTQATMSDTELHVDDLSPAPTGSSPTNYLNPTRSSQLYGGASGGVVAAPSPRKHALVAKPHKMETSVVSKSVVKIYVSSVEYDYGKPWSPVRREVNAFGSGFLVTFNTVAAFGDHFGMPQSPAPPSSPTHNSAARDDQPPNKRQGLSGTYLVTNAHVVAQATYIEIRRAGSDKKVVCKVRRTCHDVDIALLEIDDADDRKAFLQSATPLQLGETPYVGETVTAFGFPIGGEEMSLTRGAVSRVELQNGAHSGHYVLSVDTDTSIAPGNSGGPVLSVDGRVAGISFQGISGKDGGFFIAVDVLKKALFEDLVNARTYSVPDLGIVEQELESKLLKQFLNVPSEGIDGVIICKIAEFSPVAGKLKPYDVLTKIDGFDIGSNGTIEFREGERTIWDYGYMTKTIGESITLEFFRCLDSDRVLSLQAIEKVKGNSAADEDDEDEEDAPDVWDEDEGGGEEDEDGDYDEKGGRIRSGHVGSQGSWGSMNVYRNKGGGGKNKSAGSGGPAGAGSGTGTEKAPPSSGNQGASSTDQPSTGARPAVKSCPLFRRQVTVPAPAGSFSGSLTMSLSSPTLSPASSPVLGGRASVNYSPRKSNSTNTNSNHIPVCTVEEIFRDEHNTYSLNRAHVQLCASINDLKHASCFLWDLLPNFVIRAGLVFQPQTIYISAAPGNFRTAKTPEHIYIMKAFKSPLLAGISESSIEKKAVERINDIKITSLRDVINAFEHPMARTVHLTQAEMQKKKSSKHQVVKMFHEITTREGRKVVMDAEQVKQVMHDMKNHLSISEEKMQYLGPGVDVKPTVFGSVASSTVPGESSGTTFLGSAGRTSSARPGSPEKVGSSTPSRAKAQARGSAAERAAPMEVAEAEGRTTSSSGGGARAASAGSVDVVEKSASIPNKRAIKSEATTPEQKDRQPKRAKVEEKTAGAGKEKDASSTKGSGSRSANGGNSDQKGSKSKERSKQNSEKTATAEAEDTTGAAAWSKSNEKGKGKKKNGNGKGKAGEPDDAKKDAHAKVDASGSGRKVGKGGRANEDDSKTDGAKDKEEAEQGQAGTAGAAASTKGRGKGNKASVEADDKKRKGGAGKGADRGPSNEATAGSAGKDNDKKGKGKARETSKGSSEMKGIHDHVVVHQGKDKGKGGGKGTGSPKQSEVPPPPPSWSPEEEGVLSPKNAADNKRTPTPSGAAGETGEASKKASGRGRGVDKGERGGKGKGKESLSDTASGGRRGKQGGSPLQSHTEGKDKATADASSSWVDVVKTRSKDQEVGPWSDGKGNGKSADNGKNPRRESAAEAPAGRPHSGPSRKGERNSADKGKGQSEWRARGGNDSGYSKGRRGEDQWRRHQGQQNDYDYEYWW